MSILRSWSLPVLTVVMGMQLLRVFIPSLAWYMRDTVGLSSVSLAPFALGTFLAAFLAAPVRRVVGSRAAVQLSAVGVAAARVLEQLSSQPAVDLWLSIAGTAMFLLFLPVSLGHLRAQRGSGATRWAFALPLGLALDVALHGASGSLDLSWASGPVPLAVVALIAALGAWSAWSLGPSDGNSETGWAGALPLIGIGPFLLLQVLIFQSYGWVEQMAGIGAPAGDHTSLAELGRPAAAAWLPAAGARLPLGWFFVMLGNLALMLGVRQGFWQPTRHTSLLALGASIYLPLVTYYATTPGWPFIVSVTLTQLVLGWGWGTICRRAAAPGADGLERTGICLPLGTLLFLSLAFVYYVALNTRLPFPRAWVLPFGALLFGLSVLAASRAAERAAKPAAPDEITAAGTQPAAASEAPSVVSSHSAHDAGLPPQAGPPHGSVGNSPPGNPSRPAAGPLWTAAALLLVPWVAWAVRGPQPEPEAGHTPLRIMTYNIHSGFGATGRHDPEAIARVIEASGADIVALQEVSRVRLLDGGTDLSTWLSRRLGFPILFQGTEEPIWGNAILSRYPVLRWGWADLPREGALIGRGYLWAEIDVGFPLLVINTHLHHVEHDNYVRLAELPVVLNFWAQRPTSILLGDLNAEPHYPEMALPAAAGLVDAWDAAGSGDGLTWSAADPVKRIDWIWHSADLETAQVGVIASLASDHLPVIAEVQLVP